MKPQRRCIGCGKSFDQDTLIRYTYDGSKLIADKDEKNEGRGCYLCRNKDCLEKAVKRKAFGRALKCEISSEALREVF